jgi:hypothetical protein
MKNSMFHIIRFAIIFNLLTLFIALAYSQPDRDFEKKRDQIKAQKVAFITGQLNLTPQEAEKFWPVYNECEDKKEGIKKEFIADDQILLAQRLLDLQKEYQAKYKTILPIRKVVMLYQAEREFRHVLLERIRERDRDRRF